MHAATVATLAVLAATALGNHVHTPVPTPAPATDSTGPTGAGIAAIVVCMLFFAAVIGMWVAHWRLVPEEQAPQYRVDDDTEHGEALV